MFYYMKKGIDIADKIQILTIDPPDNIGKKYSFLLLASM